MRSSHLSFQEYFTVRAICTGKHRLRRDAPPWRWGPFWANVVKLGCENGTTFGSGLLRAAGVEGDELNLSRELGGDRPTVLAVVCVLMGSLRVLDLSNNELCPAGGAALAEGLKGSSTLTKLDLSSNGLGPKECFTIAGALRVNRSLTTLVLQGNKLGPKSGVALAEALKINGSLTSLDLTANDLGDEGCKVVFEALLVNGLLTSLDLGENKIGPDGGVAAAKALKIIDSLTSLDLRSNGLDGTAKTSLKEATSAKVGFKLLLD